MTYLRNILLTISGVIFWVIGIVLTLAWAAFWALISIIMTVVTLCTIPVMILFGSKPFLRSEQHKQKGKSR